MKPHFLALAAALTAAPVAFASEETRSLDAHVHGHGSLDIAVEDGTVAMAFEAPGADIVGFEHAARSDEDRAAVEAAKATLGAPLDLFVLPEAAGCAADAAEVSMTFDHEDEDGHGDGHEEGHDDGHEHDHDEDHADHDEEQDGHSEFRAIYRLTCTDPAAIDAIRFAYFDRFPNAQELEVRIVSDRGARGFEVEREEPTLDLGGAI